MAQATPNYFLEEHVLQLIRPLSVSSVYGLVWTEPYLMAVDPRSGYLLAINPETGQTHLANAQQVDSWRSVTGLATNGSETWVLREDQLLRLDKETGQLELVLELEYLADGLAFGQEEWFVSVEAEKRIHVYSRKTHALVRSFEAPGTGEENLTYARGQLWVTDRIEQTVYCVDPQTGEICFSVLTPYEQPTGLVWAGEWLYVAYTQVEDFIKEEPNRDNRLVLDSRSKTLIHRLQFRTDPEHYTLSNGYLIEVVYCEETSTLEPVELENVVWKIALPVDSHRQKLLHVEAIGRPFSEEVEAGQRVAVFKFDRLAAGEVQLFGWKALLEVRGIRYHVPPALVESAEIPEAIETQYLHDDDYLAMDTRKVQEAAVDAVGAETNPLARMLAIRSFVYDKLDYRIQRVTDPPDAVLARGKGSCGEYVGVMLALARLNGIPCRTVGRYKCPILPDSRQYPLRPEYNHVWIEFYLPGYGWVPCESNADDIGTRPYPRRFFMALPWYHIELDKGIPFETTNVRGYSLADLSVNHVQVTILKELPEFDAAE